MAVTTGSIQTFFVGGFSNLFSLMGSLLFSVVYGKSAGVLLYEPCSGSRKAMAKTLWLPKRLATN
jgi:hypothetical protein